MRLDTIGLIITILGIVLAGAGVLTMLTAHHREIQAIREKYKQP